jgi:hypothetical protein
MTSHCEFCLIVKCQELLMKVVAPIAIDALREKEEDKTIVVALVD